MSGGCQDGTKTDGEGLRIDVLCTPCMTDFQGTAIGLRGVS